jgi:hypothetical protein
LPDSVGGSVRWLIRESDAAAGLELAGGGARGTGPSRGFGWIVAEANRIDGPNL